MSRASSIKAFRKAVELLQSIDPDLSLYVSSDTLCLMAGPTHDQQSQPLKNNAIEYAGSLRISGGDW